VNLNEWKVSEAESFMSRIASNCITR